MTVTKDPFIVECRSVEEANGIDMDKYRISERMSESRSSFIFLKRGGR